MSSVRETSDTSVQLTFHDLKQGMWLLPCFDGNNLVKTLYLLYEALINLRETYLMLNAFDQKNKKINETALTFSLYLNMPRLLT